jgi:hypothetical protein
MRRLRACSGIAAASSRAGEVGSSTAAHRDRRRGRGVLPVEARACEPSNAGVRSRGARPSRWRTRRRGSDDQRAGGNSAPSSFAQSAARLHRHPEPRFQRRSVRPDGGESLRRDTPGPLARGRKERHGLAAVAGQSAQSSDGGFLPSDAWSRFRGHPLHTRFAKAKKRWCHATALRLLIGTQNK